MTSRLKTMDKENEIESDWKFAAMVIDRWVMVVMVMMTMMVMMGMMTMVMVVMMTIVMDRKMGSQSTNESMTLAAMTHNVFFLKFWNIHHITCRFCLIIFTTFTIITTVAVLFSAPHILVD